MLPSKARTQVENASLCSNLSSTVNSYACHKIIFVIFLRVSHPSCNWMEHTFKHKSSFNILSYVSFIVKRVVLSCRLLFSFIWLGLPKFNFGLWQFRNVKSTYFFEIVILCWTF